MRNNRKLTSILLAISSFCFGASLLTAAPSDSASMAVAQTPAMGWNSWNRFGCGVSDKLIRETAEAMVSTGLQAAGYKYVNIGVSNDSFSSLVPKHGVVFLRISK